MQIVLTINFPTQALTERLKRGGLTMDEFRNEMREALPLNASDFCDGATATLEFKE